jgi:nicotinamide-nucleotide amidase
MSEESLEALARRFGAVMAAGDWMVTTAESCTGGAIAKTITDVAGSSAWLDRGFVTYTNDAKHHMLAVPEATLDAHGAVSSATVEAMVTGALTHSAANLAVAVSGVAGPAGGTADKPVGLVWFAWARRGHPPEAQVKQLDGDRGAVRGAAVRVALNGLIELAEEAPL